MSEITDEIIKRNTVEQWVIIVPTLLDHIAELETQINMYRAGTVTCVHCETSADIEQQLEDARTELSALREANRWIPAGERLPQDEAECLVVNDENEIERATRKLDRPSGWMITEHGDYEGCDYGIVTYWRLLPLPPELK
jgi:hypothetical protein